MARPMIDPPSWYTPERLLGIFCWITFLVYLDRGVIACNGVNGSARTVDQPQGTGIQVHLLLCMIKIHAANVVWQISLEFPDYACLMAISQSFLKQFYSQNSVFATVSCPLAPSPSKQNAVVGKRL